MSTKNTPLPLSKIEEICRKHPTPFHIYDEAAIRENAKRLRNAFSWNAGFKEYFAVKATPNPFLLKLLKAEGFGADCSSLPEMMLANQVGICAEDVMFTSNDTPANEFTEALKTGAIINLDDISHIESLVSCGGVPELICFRYNPGPLKEGNAIIGHPEEAKYGLTREQLFDAYRRAKELGATRFGIHTMVASNELNPLYFIETAEMLFDLVVELSQALDITFEFINMGGGIGIPYRPDEGAVDIDQIGKGVKQAFESKLIAAGHPPVRIYLECGRMITGPYGWLISKVIHLKKTYKQFVGLDSCMADLMRPALYGAYHHITVMGKEQEPEDTLYDVTGSLCENNDKFAIDRMLPKINIGDIIVIHDAGAHGHAMGFNYNAKLRSAELLLRPDGSVTEIRRAETIEDHFATLDFNALREFSV